MRKIIIYIGLIALCFFTKLANAQLVADFSADPRSGCAPIRVVFKDLSVGNIEFWKWDLGNGTITSAQNPSTTYFTPGFYTITLTIYNGPDSSKITKTNYISVFANPTIKFSGSPTNGCIPLPVRFTDSSKSGTGTINSWQWDFGDGNISLLKNPVHNYLTQGIFKVTLTVKTTDGCFNSDSKLNYITVNDSIKAKFSFSTPTTCTTPVVVKFTDQSFGTNLVKWTWSFGDGGTSNLQNPSHNYTTQGLYTAKLIIENNTGCKDSIEQKSVVSAGVFKADFTNTANVCQGKAVIFTNTSIPFAILDSSRWFFGDGSTASAINPVKTYTSPGTYTVKVISYFGKCKDSTTKTITIVAGPKADFTANPRGICKPPLTVNFTNNSTGAVTYSWNLGNGQTSTLPNPTYTYNNFGYYNIRLIADGGNGCIDTIFKPNYIAIAAPSIQGINGAPYKGCFPYTQTFSVRATLPDPIVSWEWDFGDGTTSNASNPTHTYSVVGGYVISVKITTQSGCVSTFNDKIRGGSKPKSNFSAMPRLVCPEDQVFFTDSSSNASEWLWFFGDGGTSVESNPVHQYQDTGWMNVTLITSNNGCSDTLRIFRYVYVNPPIARFIDSFNCNNQFEHFFQDTSIGAMTWFWRFGTYDSTTERNTRYVFPDTGRIPVTLRVADTVCKHQTTKYIFILDEKADFVMADTGSCTQTKVRLTATGPKTHMWNIKRYLWDFGDGYPVVTDTNFIEKQYTQGGVVNVRLQITDLNDCLHEITKPITVRLYGPKANFGPVYQAACAGSLVSFVDSSSSDPSSPIKQWTWNFGFGNDVTFTSAPFGRVYPNAGVYDVKLTVTDALGCTDSILRPKAVVIYKPQAQFFSPDTVVCVNSPVRFNNLSTGSRLTYAWTFDNGTTSTTKNPITQYPAEGKYDIKLVIKDSLNCTDSLFKPKYITVSDAKSEFTISDSFTTCPPLVVKFSNKSVNNFQNIWDFGNGNSSALINPTHTYTFPGSFTATLKVIGNGGCSDSSSKQIKIQGPLGNIRYGPLGGCPPLQVNFASTAINTKFYTWDFSDGSSTFTPDSTTSHIYRIPGTYIPRLILEDGLGCKLPIPGLDTIKVLGAKALIKKLQRLYYCDSATVQFFDSTIANDKIVSFKWDFGDGTSSNLRNPAHSYTKPGRYFATLEVITSTGCRTLDSLPVPIQVAASPKIAMGKDSSVCLPSTVQHQVLWLNQDTTTVAWFWQLGNGTTSNKQTPPPITYNTAGKYQITVYATSNYGCGDTLTKLLTVNDTPKIVADPYAYLCLGQSVTLKATGAKTYQWNNSPALSCLNCASPIATPLQTSIFKVIGTDSNNCKAQDTVLIRIVQPTNLIPGPGDTICIGESVRLNASGKMFYTWSPATGLNTTNGPNVIAKPISTTRYRVVGTDSLGCFTDSAFYNIQVYPIPTVNIIDDKITANTGSLVILRTKASPDVTRWSWSPGSFLSCTDCPEPVVTVSQSLTYKATVTNPGFCQATDEITVETVCNGNNIYVPNTFSPNGDGQNDVFYPRGKGLASIRNMKIFNRWGEVMFERKDFAVNIAAMGWDGTNKGQTLTPDVFVYLIEIVCDNNVILNLKGNVTLLK